MVIDRFCSMALPWVGLPPLIFSFPSYQYYLEMWYGGCVVVTTDLDAF